MSRRSVSMYWSGPLLLGLGQDETPSVLPLPWEKPTEADLEAQRKAEAWTRFSQAIAVAGGVVGLILGVRALVGVRGSAG